MEPYKPEFHNSYQAMLPHISEQYQNHSNVDNLDKKKKYHFDPIIDFQV